MDNYSMQSAMRHAEIVEESKFADCGPGSWYYLKLGPKVIPLGHDKFFAEALLFCLVRNADAWSDQTTDDN
jgi:hypothetical protein